MHPDPLSRARRLDVERPAIESYYPEAVKALRGARIDAEIHLPVSQFCEDLDRAFEAGQHAGFLDALWLAASGVVVGLFVWGCLWVTFARGGGM